ncbi:MAG: rubrerythrin family protein, partial [Candidatus Lokiarchaeia archaeon]|nr:rubrerythrin family protein [Candidatus Lokiarchaeia archaeon]
MGNTARNLMTGFVKESQTSTRYEIYADIARKENFLLLYKTFKELSAQKKERAISLYKFLKKLKINDLIENLIVEIRTATTFGTTIENLEACINEGDELWQKLYPDFEHTAKIEGYMDIANRFKEIIQIERNLSQRLKMFLNLIN